MSLTSCLMLSILPTVNSLHLQVGRLARQGVRGIHTSEWSAQTWSSVAHYLPGEISMAATIKGFEVITCKPRVKEEIRFVNKLFDIFAVAA
ncbi:Mobile element protein [Acidisarcina polymorpha]|uniref:Mobile element protein n=1 Tax=Acidisarcina polymorpha TaxID=2211140 RepID=A0A2Z5G064_9BACT|nr:Mobile element protein [Acidisarcina polymorpha]